MLREYESIVSVSLKGSYKEYINSLSFKRKQESIKTLGSFNVNINKFTWSAIMAKLFCFLKALSGSLNFPIIYQKHE